MDISQDVRGSVVVGVDGSGSSDMAAAWAVRHAAKAGRPLVVLHAIGYPGLFPVLPDLYFAEEGLVSEGSDLASAAAAKARELEPDVDVRAKATLGDPGHVLAEAADFADVVVVGSRGRNPAVSLLLGSVSLSLISRGKCPVVVVRSGTGPTAGESGPVIVGVDGTQASTAALEFAFRQASYDGVPLTVAHAAWDPLPFSAAMEQARTPAEQQELTAQEALAESEAIAGMSEKYPDVTVDHVSRNGDPAKILADLSHSASLVVVGSRGYRAPVTTLVGSVGRRLVEHADGPVAVVRP